MQRIKTALYLLLSLVVLGFSGCGPAPDYLDIRIDAVYEDWENVEPVYTAPKDSSGPVREVRMADTPDRLFVRFDLDEELILQVDNDLVFHLDLDRDPVTGLEVGEIGADFSWYFGRREGVLRLPGRNLPRNTYQAGLVASPSVSSARFELELVRDLGGGEGPEAFSSPEIGWALTEESSGGAGYGPAAGTYRLQNRPPAPYPEISLARPEEPHFRLLSYNVLWDGLTLRPQPFNRILKALDPDVIAFQEIGAGTEEGTRGRVEEILGRDWHSARRKGCITVSRFPILAAAAVDGNLATLLDLSREGEEKEILLVNCHLPFGPNHRERTVEIANLMAFLESAKRGEGEIPLEEGTPIVVLGDMNLVGSSEHLRVLKQGEDGKPDWDATPLADLHPYHSAAPRSYTWQSPRRTGFGPSRLDYVFYTDSVLSPVKSFVLATDSMDRKTLKRQGLRRGDAVEASDHYPVTVDFRLIER
ncbi:MAG: endonuclease/exonuclease/phosphatase family protein [Candidatus Erginobacter occultus]|nr:endonuclease/exonuclease/phosphatase family protein [Candidatus Erginobacter occultus]